MTTDLAVRNNISSIGEIQQVARLLAMSNYFDAKGNGEQAIAQLATKILAGQEMGYGPFASVQGIHVIQGKPTMSANLMASAVKNSARYDYRVRQMEDTAVSVEFFERIGGKLESLGVSTFTLEDAKKAGTQNLQKFARNMLFARAMSNGVRWYCPDVFFGSAVYTPDELGAPVDADGEYIDTTVTQVTPPQAPRNGNGNSEPPADSDNPFHGDDPDVISTATMKQLHAVGTQLYGKEWAKKRPELVKGITKGAHLSANDLTEAQAQKLIAGMNQRIAAQAASVNEPMPMDMESIEELAH